MRRFSTGSIWASPSGWCRANSNRRVDRSSVSTEQKENLDAILRQGAFPASADVNEQRRQFKALLSAQPLPGDVTVTAATLGGVEFRWPVSLYRAPPMALGGWPHSAW